MNIRAKLDIQKVERDKLSASERKKNKQRQIKAALATDSGVYVQHVYQVFNDTDFETDVAQLRSKFEGLYYKNIALTTSDADIHLLDEDKELIKQLADKYCITVTDLGLYADGAFDDGCEFGHGDVEYGGFHFELTADGYRMYYLIGPKTTLEQIQKSWNFIKGMRAEFLENSKENTKSKSPQNPELIYAIFKARTRDGLKFSQIFNLYENGKLPGYTGKNTRQYKSEDSLERYYRKYKPELQRNNIISPN